jgi:hypothetical protein
MELNEDQIKTIQYLDLIIDGKFNRLEREYRFAIMVGFCYNWRLFNEKYVNNPESKEDMDLFIPTYSLYSGDFQYPIPYKNISPYEAYSSLRNKWNYNSIYGANRKQFVVEFKQYLINKWSK